MMSEATFQIDGKNIGENQPAFVIAEIGINHNGDIETAHAMVDAIAESGCDCVKFQTFHADEFCSNEKDTYEYVSQDKIIKESMLEMFRRFELKQEEFAELFVHARERGLAAFSTPTDIAAVDLLADIGVDAYKIGSDDLVYTPFLEYVAKKGKPVIISTGMATLEDVQRAVDVLKKGGLPLEQIAILHCISAYPTPADAIHLNRIPMLQGVFPGCIIGFSDHSWGITPALGAVALGARIVEKHFTLDHNMAGPDHRFSADPKQLTDLVREVRVIEQALGQSELVMSKHDQEMAALCHRSVYAASDLPVGKIIELSDLVFQRPGSGLKPYEVKNIVGRQLTGRVDAGTAFDLDMFGDR